MKKKTVVHHGMLCVLMIDFLLGLAHGAEREISEYELPEVTILGKDASEFESPDSFNLSYPDRKKDLIQHLDFPEKSKTVNRSSLKSLYLSAGRYGTVTTGADLAGTDEKIDYLFQLKYARTDGYRPHSAEDFFKPLGSIGMQLKDWMSLNGEFSYFQKRMDLPGPVDAPTPTSHRENALTDFDSSVEITSGQGQLMVAHFFGKISRIEENLIQEIYDDVLLGGGLTLDHGPMKAGIELTNEKLQNYYYFQTVSCYGGVSDYEIYDNLYLESILQMDFYEGMAIRIDPKVALTWYVTDKLSTKIRVDRELEVRSWSESYLTENYVEPNLTEIEPQRTLKGELCAEYQFQEGLIGSVTLFRHEIKDLLIWQDEDQDGLFTLVNQSKAMIQGIGLGMDATWLKSLKTSAMLKLQQVKGEDSDGDHVPYLPEVGFDIGLDWKGPKGIGLGTTISYVGQQYIDIVGSEKIEDYILWDIRASYQWRGITVFAKVLNVLDETYDIRYGYPGPNTQYQFGVTLEF